MPYSKEIPLKVVLAKPMKVFSEDVQELIFSCLPKEQTAWSVLFSAMTEAEFSRLIAQLRGCAFPRKLLLVWELGLNRAAYNVIHRALVPGPLHYRNFLLHEVEWFLTDLLSIIAMRCRQLRWNADKTLSACNDVIWLYRDCLSFSGWDWFWYVSEIYTSHEQLLRRGL